MCNGKEAQCKIGFFFFKRAKGVKPEFNKMSCCNFIKKVGYTYIYISKINKYIDHSHFLYLSFPFPISQITGVLQITTQIEIRIV